MRQHSSTWEGFAAMFRRPTLGLAEIAWRWSFGLAATLLLWLSLLEYLDTLPVTAADLFLLRSRHPFLISQALAHIFRGSMPRLVMAAIVLLPALTMAWIVIASAGRAATIQALVSNFRTAFHPSLRSLLGLNFLRAGATLAAAVSCVAAWLLGGAASPDSDPSPGSALLVFLTVVLLVSLAWSLMNWFLSLAAVFAVAEGKDTFGALADAVGVCRTRPGAVLAASTWFGLAHVVVFFVASSVVAFPLAFASLLPAGVVLGGVLLVTLCYFAIVDFLYVGRLAAYLAILQAPPGLTPVASTAPNAQPENKVDQDEPILSDTKIQDRELET